MSNREERKEVAKKLREVGKGNSGWFMTIQVAIFKISDIIGAQCKSYEFFFNRLADLIDPTCKYLPNVHAVWFDDNDEEYEDTSLEALGNSENAYCSVCGYEMMTGEEGWFDYEREEHGNRLIPNFNYCPNCGARVVQDDRR